MDKFKDENTCRICFKIQDVMYSLFRKRKGASPCDKLQKLGLKAIVNHGWPTSICCDCLIELDSAISFLQKCEKSNQILEENYSLELKNNAETTGYNDSLNVEVENYPFNYESRIVERIKVVHQELNVGEAVKSSNIPEIEDPRCGECGSRRRCRHWTPPTTHTCPHCQKVFTRKFNFKLHVARHGSREWWCLECGAGAVSRWLAARHCRPRRRRACPVPGCTRTYTSAANLSTHMTVHTGERPFECNDCGKKFTSKNTLTDHMRIHTGALPYICPVCGKRFRTNKLSVHMQTHAGAGGGRGAGGGARRVTSRRGGRGAPHACALCPARYHHRQSLNKHTRKQHAHAVLLPNDSVPTADDQQISHDAAAPDSYTVTTADKQLSK